MKTEKIMKKFSAGILLALFIIAGIPAVPVQAAAGTVYTCAVHPSYRHPVTGEIEDSGGEASYATGQGMVDGAVYPTGILELTDSGEYYLTIRMSLMDYTANHSFWVQNVGDSGWSTPALGVTGSGTDNAGAAAYFSRGRFRQDEGFDLQDCGSFGKRRVAVQYSGDYFHQQSGDGNAPACRQYDWRKSEIRMAQHVSLLLRAFSAF